MTRRELTDQVKQRVRGQGFDIVGISAPEYGPHRDYYAVWVERGFAGELHYMTRNADRRSSPEKVVPEVRSIVCVGLNYFRPDPPERYRRQPLWGQISKYARNDDYHEVIKPRLLAVMAQLRDLAGHPATGRVYVDTGPVLEKALAERAGIGWIGKHTNLISREIGSWFFLAEILTSLDLEPDTPHRGFCGSCHRCIDACPTGAIVEPYQLDARLCISYLTIELKGVIPRELRPLIGNRIYGCDDCQDVCPWNRFARLSTESAFVPREALETPLLTEIIGITPEEFSDRFRRSPIKRIKRRGLLRNVAVALGNTHDPAVLPALATAIYDAEPLVRLHAAWAVGVIGGAQANRLLTASLETEKDSDVRGEIEWAIGHIASRTRQERL